MNELNLLYKSILLSWNADIKNDSKIVILLDGQEFPVTLDGQDIHLPTNEALDQDTNGMVFFHPACESIISKETEIFKIVRRMASFSLLVNFKKFPPVLFDVAQKKSKKTMRNNVMEVMDKLSKTKQNQRKEIANIFESIEAEINTEKGIDARFVHFDIKRGGRSKLTGDKLYYSCKPVFPFYNELAKRLARSEGQPDNRMVTLFGRDYSKGSLEIAEEILRFVIPSIDDPINYEQEQLTAEAARFTVLVNTFGAIAGDINSCQNMFRQFFDKAGVYEIDLSYLSELENIDAYYRQVPALPYNTQTTKEPESNVQLASQLSNTFSVNSNPTPQYNNVTTGALNQHTANSHIDNTGYVNEVKQMLAPGETWLAVTKDPMTGKFMHTIQGPMGMSYVYMSQAGNFLSKENIGVGMGMGMPGMNGMMTPQMQQQIMMQQMMNQQMMGGGQIYHTTPQSVVPNSPSSSLQTY